MNKLLPLLVSSLLLALACAEPAHEVEDSPFVYTMDVPGDPAFPAHINGLCPISKEKLGPDMKIVTFKSLPIGLCCADCVPEFEKLDDAGKTAALEAVGTQILPASPK